MNEQCTRREFLAAAVAGAGAVALSPSPCFASSGARPPNVLFVFADQLRYCDLGCMGNTVVKTPHLDKLASEGVLFANSFSCTPVCGPYRSQLMTGKYGHMTGVLYNEIKLPDDQVCIADVLKEAGYRTGYIGKWHLEGCYNAPANDPRKQGFVPPGRARHGWDYWAGLEVCHNYFKTKYYLDDPKAPVAVTGYEPDVQTDLAIEYLKRNRDQPFCLMLSFGPPHDPYTPPDKYRLYKPEDIVLRPNVPGGAEKQARAALADYYGLITSLDDEMGRLMKALDEFGLSENTVVCFTSDHGDMLFSQGQERKERPWEESVHVPFLMRYPKKLRAGRIQDMLFSSVDIMPTLLGFCGAPIPKGVQGQDLSPAILGLSDKMPDSVYLSLTVNKFYGQFAWAKAPKDGSWRGVRTKEWKYAVNNKGDWLLYNLKDDPHEQNNLVGDKRFDVNKGEMKALVGKWIDRIGENPQLAKP